MNVEVTIDIEAPGERVWAVVVDVERWNEWTKSITAIERLDQGAFGLGSRVRIRQPGFPAAVWEVTAYDEGREFAWTSKAPGLTTVAVHRVEPRGDGGSKVTLAIEQRGMFEPVIRLLAGSRTRRYVQMEADGLKRRCEEG